jgi:hypothetical protein
MSGRGWDIKKRETVFKIAISRKWLVFIEQEKKRFRFRGSKPSAISPNQLLNSRISTVQNQTAAIDERNFLFGRFLY